MIWTGLGILFLWDTLKGVFARADWSSRPVVLVRIFAISLVALMVANTAAEAQTRSLKLYYIHTKERATITYKKNGKYVPSGLKKINRFLRDWRRNEATKIDPQLLDILWEVYRKVGARDHIHVVSAYRSPATNAMLRRTRGGQAKKSQHTLGKAIDFYIPGVSVKKLREVGFKMQGGGVGYYPKSGVPFVHLDTGNVRAWPRMSRQQLTRLFPNGRTLHLPPDGKPLPGYQQALADYKKRKARGQATAITTRGSDRDRGGSRNGGNLIATLFGGGADADEDTAAARERTKPRQRGTTQPATAKPAPRVETPETLLAALPASSMPRPAIAPRPTDRGVAVEVQPQPVIDTTPVRPLIQTERPTPAATPQAPVPPAPVPSAPIPTAPVATSEPALVASLPDFEPPIPSRRPRVLLASAEPAPAIRRSAAELEAALAAANTQAGSVVNGTAQTASDDDAQREAILAALRARPRADLTEQPTELAYVLPIPSSAPRRPAAELPQTLAAYAPPADLRPRVADKPVPETKTARLPIPAQRSIIDAGPDQTLTASLSTGVRTTKKSAKPTENDQAEIASSGFVTPGNLAAPDPRRFGKWTTTTASLITQTAEAKRPDFVKNAQRAAPSVVYTQGFEQRTATPDATRFSGSAVTFLAVAKFDGGIAQGDGQPLTLQVPATN